MRPRLLDGHRSEMQHFPFPNFDRVVYRTNPLIEVVCELRFPKILRIENELPADFQDKIRAEHPVLEEEKAIEIEMTTAAGSATSPTVKQTVKKSYKFLDMDRSWKIGLTADSIALSWFAYERREVFFKRLRTVLLAYIAVYGTTPITRCGFRYRNVIDRKKLQLEKKKWTELMSPQLVGLFSDLNLDENLVIDSKNSFHYRINGDSEFLRLNHGFVINQENRIGYSIDSDFWTERIEDLNIDATIKLLERYSRGAGQVFRWSISELLHGVLGPQDPV